MKVALLVRAAGTLVVMFLGWQIGSLIGSGPGAQPRNAILGIAIGAVLGFLVAPVLIARPYQAIRTLLSRTPLTDLLYGTVGLILGLIVGALLAFPLSFLPWFLGHVLPLVAAAVCAYLGVSLVLMRRRELNSFLHSRFGARADGSAEDGQHLLVDTSAIIDGRIADITQTGFLNGTLVIPRFILHELQHIADSADPLRRNRGRRGLEMLNRLQKDTDTPVEVMDVDVRDISDVDGKLVKLARDMHGAVITNDFNLNRVAELQGVRVLNVNQLANALKPVVLPGEEMSVNVIQEGKEYNQGVAYLDDGTMIVVENGRSAINKEIDVVVTRVLQTVAGRMIFAQPKQAARD